MFSTLTLKAVQRNKVLRGMSYQVCLEGHLAGSCTDFAYWAITDTFKGIGSHR